MDGRLLLILCLGLLQVYLPGSMVNGQGAVAPQPLPPTPPPTKEWCVLHYKMNTGEITVLSHEEIQTLPHHTGCITKEDAILCNVASKQYSNCKIDDIKLHAIPDEVLPVFKTKLADWFLQNQTCVWQFPSELKDDKIEWNSEGTRAKAEHFNYTTELKGCRFENDKNVTVCSLEPTVPCEGKYVKIESLTAIANDEICDEKCIGSLVEAQAIRLQICILKFKFDESTSSVTFMGTPSGADYKQIPELWTFTDCSFYPSDQKSIFFCRSNDSSTCTEEYHKGNIVLNFFDKLNLGKEVTSKIMRSVLNKDICLWRLTYELDEYKDLHYDDFGHRLTEYEHREKIVDCIRNKKEKTVTCIIGKETCEFSSIINFDHVQKYIEGKLQKDKEFKLLTARKRFGPCFSLLYHYNCSFESNQQDLTFRHLLATDNYPFCMVDITQTTVHCWATEIQMQKNRLPYGMQYSSAANRACFSGGLARLSPEIYTKFGNMKKIDNALYHVVIEYTGDGKGYEPCEVVSYKFELATEIGCINTDYMGVYCYIPFGAECSANHFANGKGLEDLLPHLPATANCSKKNVHDYFEDLWLGYSVHGDPEWYLATTTTVDPYAYINNPSINSSGGIMYPPVEIEFKDPPSKEEIKAQREALTGRKNEKRENNMGKRLSVLSVFLLPLQFFFL